MKTLAKPTLVYHADWGSKAPKRWYAKATLGEDGRYTASGPTLVGDLTPLIDNLRAEAGALGTVFAGFDFPIGIPSHFAERAGILKFREFLPQLGQDVWKDFHSVCDTPEQISIHRPFYPNRSRKGCLPSHLFTAHDVTTMEPLFRRCERGGNGQRQACSLFWTLGGNQVGKAALIGWRDVLAPALRDGSAVRLWPFDGKLETLFEPGYTVVAETYPAECYGWFPGDPLRSKTDIEGRKSFGSRLLAWAHGSDVVIAPQLANAIETGFSDGEDDAFDAVVGLFGMLQVALGHRTTGEPEDETIRSVEGWILGRRWRTKMATMTQSTTERLQHFGGLLHQLLLDLPEHAEITDTLDYILGALYGLSRAHEVGFRDRTSSHVADYRAYLADDALNISKERAVSDLWLAGFYFNSGIQRIASAFDRIPRMLGAKMEEQLGGKRRRTHAKERMAEVNRTPFAKWEAVYDEVNAFKHQPEGRAMGRTVNMTDAIDSFEQMLSLLADGKQKLVARYKNDA